jgi:hypothetical protein
MEPLGDFRFVFFTTDLGRLPFAPVLVPVTVLDEVVVVTGDVEEVVVAVVVDLEPFFTGALLSGLGLDWAKANPPAKSTVRAVNISFFMMDVFYGF